MPHKYTTGNMPVFVAYIKADLENVGSAAIDVESATLTIDVKYGQSEEVRESVTICRQDEEPLDGSRGVANLILKFADANERSSCSVLSADEFKTRFKKKKQALAEMPRSVTDGDSGTWVPVVAFEARGMDVVTWRLREGDVSVRSATGFPFEDVDLSEGDWADYDVEADAPVAMSDIETKVGPVR